MVDVFGRSNTVALQLFQESPKIRSMMRLLLLQRLSVAKCLSMPGRSFSESAFSGVSGFQADMDRIRARGFLKAQRPYQPPSEQSLKDLVISVASVTLGDSNCSLETNIDGLNAKCQILNGIAKRLSHSVPSSQLHEMKTLADVCHFYSQPVKNVTDYVQLARSQSKPKNLHVNEEPTRFHPESDTQYGGVTAFPKQDGTVFNLRYRRLYPEFQAKKEWHHFEDKSFDYRSPPKSAPWVDADDNDRIHDGSKPLDNQ